MTLSLAVFAEKAFGYGRMTGNSEVAIFCGREHCQMQPRILRLCLRMTVAFATVGV